VAVGVEQELRGRPAPLLLDPLEWGSFGLYKSEVIRRSGPWRNIEEVEFATLEWVDWFNNRRLFGPIGDIPPAMMIGLT